MSAVSFLFPAGKRRACNQGDRWGILLNLGEEKLVSSDALHRLTSNASRSKLGYDPWRPGYTRQPDLHSVIGLENT